MKIEKTQRGFGITHFNDTHGSTCSLQESSNADEACIWLGRDECRKHHVTGDCLNRMTLNQQMVIDLLPQLLHFALHGALKHE